METMGKAAEIGYGEGWRRMEKDGEGVEKAWSLAPTICVFLFHFPISLSGRLASLVKYLHYF